MSGPSTVSVVGFLDVDGYECQLYQKELPWTRFKPCIVVNSSGRIVSVSPEAKKLGISRANTPNERDVRKKFPDLVDLQVFRKDNEFGKPDSRKTRHGTWQLLDAVKEFCSRGSGNDIIIELASSDEIYLELSGVVTKGIQMRKSNGRNPEFAELDCFIVLEGHHPSRTGPFRYYFNQRQAQAWIRHAARDEERLIFGALFMRSLAVHLQKSVGFYTSSGVAMNRFAAKIACGLNKPGKTTIMTEYALPRVAKLISVTDIPGLGGKLGNRLKEELSVQTLADLRKVPLERLEKVEGIGEMASKVFSWARGRDNTAVIEKEMKNSIRCNMPSNPVISSLHRLQESIGNLCAEAKCLLEEEELRHKRIVTSLKVEFSFNSDMNQQSESFSITDYSSLKSLAPKILDHIKSAGGLDVGPNNRFILETLTFVMKDFIPVRVAPLNNLQQQLSALSLGCQPRIQELRIQSTPTFPLAKFSSHNLISSFGTLANADYYWSDKVTLPKIIPSYKYGELIGSYLGRGYEEASLISDHLGFYELKHEQFHKWLQDFQFIEKVQSGRVEKPDFICFNGRLADTMQTPDLRQFGDWEIYALNVAGIIFLWDEKKPKSAINNVIDYYGLGFESLLRGTTSQQLLTGTNEFEHVYTINSTTFGRHKLFIVNEIDGEDENGDWVELRLMNERQGYARMAKLRKLWTSNVVAGVNKLIVGTRNESGILVEIQDRTLQDLETQLGWRPNACLHFQDRLLSWMKSHLSKGNRDIVMKYSWVTGGDRINCEQIPPRQIPHLAVPRLYASYLNQLEKSFSNLSST